MGHSVIKRYCWAFKLLNQIIIMIYWEKVHIQVDNNYDINTLIKHLVAVDKQKKKNDCSLLVKKCIEVGTNYTVLFTY